jgi:hypothetical protein
MDGRMDSSILLFRTLTVEQSIVLNRAQFAIQS